MHVLTLVVSFTYSIPHFHWARVMMELLEVAVHRRGCQATVLFREQLYAADLMTAFTEHVSRWRHVMSDICHYANGYRAPSTTAPESWSDDDDGVADDYDADDPATADDDVASVAFRAAFRSHMTNWEPVMHQLLILHVPSPMGGWVGGWVGAITCISLFLCPPSMTTGHCSFLLQSLGGA